MSAQVKRSIVFSEEECLFVKDVRKEMHLEYILVGISGTAPTFVVVERNARLYQELCRTVDEIRCQPDKRKGVLQRGRHGPESIV